VSHALQPPASAEAPYSSGDAQRLIFAPAFCFLPPGFHPESEESSPLLQTAVSVLQSSYLHSTSQDSFQYNRAILVENDVFQREVRPLGEPGVAGSSGKGGISLGAADFFEHSFMGRSVFPLQHMADLPAS